jgi:multidrug resistance efflux pump
LGGILATYASSYDAKLALENAQANLKAAKARKDAAEIKEWSKEIKNIKLVLSKFPKGK